MLRFMPDENLINKSMVLSNDPIRYTMIALAINRIHKENIQGSFAEVGVYRGDTSKVIHYYALERTLYLFDTFDGFPSIDEDDNDERFRDTEVEIVIRTVGDMNNVIIKKGCFPDTAEGLENEKFAFVMIDIDKYNPTLAAIRFFYPRTVAGGYIFFHDYNSPESGWAVSKAVDLFLKDKPEKLIDIPDRWGTAFIRKV